MLLIVKFVATCSSVEPHRLGNLKNIILLHKLGLSTASCSTQPKKFRNQLLWLQQCMCIHLIQKWLSSELLHCALRIVAYPERKAPWMRCNEYCMTRPQSILLHIASMANTRMSLSHSRHLQCYLKIRYIHGALRSGYATMRNVQCNNSEYKLF